jgi:hypothetical protein
MDQIAYKVAGGQGFEPWLAESESAVLPLDDPPSKQMLYISESGWTVKVFSA